MSTKTMAERIQELASVISQTELIALINLYARDIDCKNAFEAVVKAIEKDNLETAKLLAVVNMHTHFWIGDPKPEIDVAISKAQNEFSWSSYVDFNSVSQRQGVLRGLPNIEALAKVLISKNLIQLCDFVPCPIHTFNLMLNKFDDPKQMSKTIYAIMTAKGLTRSDRHHRMKIMKDSNKLTLDLCGPKNLSPPFYCLLLGKPYLLKHFKHLPGIARRRGPFGENFLVYAWICKQRYLKHIRLFDKAELKIMLSEKYDYRYVLDLLQEFKGRNLTTAFVLAVRELLIEGKLRVSKEVNLPRLVHSRIGGKFIYQHSGIIGRIPEYSDVEHFGGQKEFDAIGDTSSCFTFEELSSEIFQLICGHLNSRAFFALLSVSKSLQQFATRFDWRYYEQLMKREFPMIYGSLKTDQSETSVDWKGKFDLYSRRENGWHNCQDPVQIRITPPNEMCAFGSILAFDENWMIIKTKYNNGTLLWNFKDQQLHHKDFTFRDKISILNSPESEFPTVVSYIGLWEVGIVNFNEPKSAIRKFKMEGWTSYYACVSPTRFIAGDVPKLYDIELSEMIVQQCNEISRASTAKYNKVNQLTAVSFFEPQNGNQYYMCILDQNLQMTHKFGPHEYVQEITWLDEFTYSTKEKNFSKLKIFDIRMPHGYVHELNNDVVKNYKPISVTQHEHIPNQTGDFTNNLFLEINTETKLACVWSTKDLTWSNVIVLPDDVKDGRVLCNSRYAAFETRDNSICLLDFMSNK